MTLSLSDVSFSYPGAFEEAVANLNLSIPDSSVTVISGSNGSGKSTLLALIAGEFLPGKGSIQGADISKIFLKQEYIDTYIDRKMFLTESLYSQEITKILNELGVLGIRDAELSGLSYGEKKLWQITSLIAQNRQLLLLDDPFSGIAPRLAAGLWRKFKSLAAAGKTVVLTCNNFDEVAVHAGYLVILNKGCIAMQGTVEEVMQNSELIRQSGLRNPRTAHLIELLEKHEGLPVPQKPLTISQARRVLSEYRLHGNKILRTGITTGTCAAAAAIAAVQVLSKRTPPEKVVVKTPEGKELQVPIKGVEDLGKTVKAWVEKDGGDDPDITHGLEINAAVTFCSEPGIIIRGGSGVGIVTRPGLAIPVGEAAINPVPRRMITDALIPFISQGQGLVVEISVPGGETVAQKTLNPQLGIKGGISILGTTGIVEPMSEDAFKNSLSPQISQVKAGGYETVVLCPGNMGQKNAIRQCGFPEETVIQMSNFVGFMLDECRRLGIKKILLFGHIGKLIKVSAGIFQTHSKIADARLEIITAWAVKAGASLAVCKELLAANTTEEAIAILRKAKLDNTFQLIAHAASSRSEQFLQHEAVVGTILTSLNGELLAWDENAKKLGRELGWHISSKS